MNFQLPGGGPGPLPEIDLTPAAEFLLRDNPEVKIVIVGHRADLMAVFPAPRGMEVPWNLEGARTPKP